MRTTLDIDNDVLAAAREKAKREKISVGKALSELARLSLLQPTEITETKNGFPLFPVRKNSKLVTLEIVNSLRDEAT